MSEEIQLASALRGVIAVLIAPYDHAGRLDESVLTDLVASIDGAGIPAITALGNTAEVFQLSADERRAHVAAVARGARRAALIAGVHGGVSDVLTQVAHARGLGYAAAMLHEPSDPFGDSQGVLAYYTAIADRADLPVVLYLRTARLSAAALREIVGHPAIAGVKYARASTADLEAARHDGDGCVWINGSAESRAREFFALGITGFTSGVANARPDLALAVHGALVARDAARLERALAPIEPIEMLRAAMHGRHNVSVLKELLRLGGVEAGEVRPPHAELAPAQLAELRAIVAGWPPVDRPPTTREEISR